jgi:hypothetical protein
MKPISTKFPNVPLSSRHAKRLRISIFSHPLSQKKNSTVKLSLGRNPHQHHHPADTSASTNRFLRPDHTTRTTTTKTKTTNTTSYVTPNKRSLTSFSASRVLGPRIDANVIGPYHQLLLENRPYSGKMENHCKHNDLQRQRQLQDTSPSRYPYL